MRVISGKTRGTKLNYPDDEITRPTSSRAKEGIFSSIQFDIDGKSVLDLYAGSGALGIEALSRGAKNAVFIEKNERAVKVIEENLKKVKFYDNSLVIREDVLSYLKKMYKTFDIVFMDPPYGKGLTSKTLKLLDGVLNDEAIILCELDRNDKEPQMPEFLELVKTYKYGRVKIIKYKKR